MILALFSNSLRSSENNLIYFNDNKKFWTTVKPLFSNKIKSAENIYLDESGEIIRNEKEVANVFKYRTKYYGYN